MMSTGGGGTRERDLLGPAKLGFEVQFVTISSLPYWQQICNHVAVVAGVADSWVYLNDAYFNSAPQQVSHSDFLLDWLPNACTVAIVRPRS